MIYKYDSVNSFPLLHLNWVLTEKEQKNTVVGIYVFRNDENEKLGEEAFLNVII
jgi:hypothetical protein